MTFWAAGAVVVAGIGSAVINSNASKNAVGAQTAAANQANQTQTDQYNQNRADMQPWRDQGTWALGQLHDLTSNGFQYDKYSDPGLAFQLKMGQDAINRQTANRGGLMAGSTLGSLENYAQGLGNSAYQGAFNRYQAQVGNLQSLAGLGMNGASQTAASGTNAANNISSNLMNMGNSQGAAYLSGANNMTGTLNNMSNQWQNYNMMQQMYPGSAGSAGQAYGNWMGQNAGNLAYAPVGGATPYGGTTAGGTFGGIPIE